MMSDLLTRPLSDQSQGVQLFVLSARRWARAAANGQCVCHVIGAAFASANLAAAVAPFHAAMRTLCMNARVPLQFGAAGRVCPSDHEAKLVAALRAAAEARRGDLRSIAEEMVFPDLAPAFAASLASVSRAFADAGLPLTD